MNVLFDFERLHPLISSLYHISGMRADIYDAGFNAVYFGEERAPFCRLINACPEGHSRCVGCDVRAMRQVGLDRPYFYRCHAGICEAILPISLGGAPLAYLFYGQYLDDSGLEAQWEFTRRSLEWYPGDMGELKKAFWAFPCYSPGKIRDYSEILAVLGDYIQLKGLILASEQTDLQRLEAYISSHYMEKLSLNSVAEALNMGRTKLCALAKELSGGSTLSKMITQRRIAAAKALLKKGSEPVAAVAEAVGISDYNYFTKVFRAYTGMTPTEFRRGIRDKSEPNP